MTTHERTRKLTLSAALLGVMLVLGWVENMFPIAGAPGVKLGLANSMLLVSLYWLGIWPSFALMVMKVFLTGFLFGSVSSMMYSFAGGLLSMLVMTLLIHGVKTSLVTAGIGGGIFHNAGQLLLSMVILQTDKLIYYMAVLMVVGMFVGAATGIAAQLLKKYVRFAPAGENPGQRKGGAA